MDRPRNDRRFGDALSCERPSVSLFRYVLPLPLLALLPFANAAAQTKAFVGAGGMVRLAHPSSVAPTRNFAGRALMNSGWRQMWDGKPVGRGIGVVRFWQIARPNDGQGQVTEMLQIGFSRSANVVAKCGTDGMASGSGRRLPDRMLGGHRWTVYTNGDAGMSQQVSATNLRSVINGACYAIDRVTYAVKAAPPPARNAPAQTAAAARMDAILATIKVGRRR
jgi:hypothetical protein